MSTGLDADPGCGSAAVDLPRVDDDVWQFDPLAPFHVYLRQLGHDLFCTVSLPIISRRIDKTIICCDYKDNHKGIGRHIMYGNGNIIWLTETEFQDEMKKPQHAPFRKALDLIEGDK